MGCKKIVVAAVAVSFFLGVMCSEPIKNIKKYFNYEAAQGFYEKPYSLKIEKRKNIEGKIETYLVDEEKNQYQKIGENMYVGDYKHRIKSVANIPKEITEKNKSLRFIFDLYDLVFD